MRNAENNRLDEQFINRWSPRAFSDKAVAPADLLTMFEAAAWSPSCFNEQPWRFVYAQTAADKAHIGQALVPANQVWALHAPVLIAVFAQRHFTMTGEVNAWANFDTGAAWMALALQASRLGYFTHAMAGFDAARAYEVCKADPKKYEILCFVALGHRGDKAQLPADLQAIEQPNARHGYLTKIHEGCFAQD